MSSANPPRGSRPAAVTILAAGAPGPEARATLARTFHLVEVVDLDLPPDVVWSRHRAEINRSILAASHEWILLLRGGESIPSELADRMRDIVTGEPVAWAYRLETELRYRGRRLRLGQTGSGEIRFLHARHCRFDLRSESLEMKAGGPVRRLPVRLVRVLYDSAAAHREAIARESRRSGLERVAGFLRTAVIERGALAGLNAVVYLWIESARQSVSDR